jgi:hypothetical protein
MNRKLGKDPATFDKRTLKLSSYLDIPKLPPLPPEGSDWFKKISQFNMAGNTDYGDCVVAGAAHMIQTWTVNAGRREVITPDQTVVAQYLKLTGGQDTGLNMLAFLNHWRKAGIFGDEKIGAFVSVNPRKITQMQYANWLFGGVFLGLMLPISAQREKRWTVPPQGPVGDGEPDSWGGHCVAVGAINSSGEYALSTWGEIQVTSPGFIPVYADEAYAIVSLSWFTTAHKTVHGFAYKDLMSDLAKITRV